MKGEICSTHERNVELFPTAYIPHKLFLGQDKKEQLHSNWKRKLKEDLGRMFSRNPRYLYQTVDCPLGECIQTLNG